jgi:hypothetical protein
MLRRALPLNFYTVTLFAILLGAFVLRIKSAFADSITADEVSALLRLQFSSFGAMIDGGVRPDGHPAFTQVLLWFWTKGFGDSTGVIRIPFVIMSTVAIGLFAQACKNWFTAHAALFLAGMLSFLQFFVMYGVLARPYAAGFFFIALLMYGLSRVSKNFNGATFALLVLGFAGAAYSHYFAGLTAVLLAVGAVFIIPKRQLLRVALAAFIAVVLFLPHFSIFLHQVSIGGIGGPGGWLGKPDSSFIAAHFFTLFNQSQGLMWLFAALALLHTVLNFRNTSRMQYVLIAVWIAVFSIGFLYSIYVNPVLQHSVLLFAAPLLLIGIFGPFFTQLQTSMQRGIAITVVLIALSHVTWHNPFELTNHFGRLQELADLTTEWQKKYTPQNIAVAWNIDDPYFIAYSFQQRNATPPDALFYKNNGYTELLAAREAVNKSSGEYFIYGWSTRYSPPEIPYFILEKYPHVIASHQWFNSAIYLFSKNPNGALKDHPFIRNTVSKFPDQATSWSTPCNTFSAQQPLTLDSNCTYSPTYERLLQGLVHHPDEQIGVAVTFRRHTPNAQLQAVFELKRGGKPLSEYGWNGMMLSAQFPADTLTHTGYFVLQLPPTLRLNDLFRCYVYTPDRSRTSVYSIELFTTKGHTFLYGSRPPFAP